MDTAFGWLGRLMEAIGSLFPRLLVVPTTHGGVAFVRGKNPRLIKPGLTVYWPVWTEVMLYPTVRQSLNLPSQTLTTDDGKTITFSAVIVYEVSDALQALTKQWDLDDTVQDIAMASVRWHVTPRTFDVLRRGSNAQLKDAINAGMNQYGVTIHDAWVTDFAETKVITLVAPDGGPSTAALSLEEE